MERVQDRSADNPALNLYEHLGLSANATSEEIRDSYLTLVRLLHPDQQRDPILRRAAEIQLKRIGRTYAILSEPKRRAEYDAMLVASIAEPLENAPEQDRRSGLAKTLPSVAWLICAIAAIFGIGWYMSQDPSVLQSITPASAANPAPKSPDSPSPPATVPEPPSKPEVAATGFAGTWSYPVASSSTSTAKAPNAPESVDFEIREENELLRGDFRVRYQVPDGVPPQDVNATFAGPNGGAVAILPWAGEHGAGGEMQLRLLTNETLEVTWTANTGRAPALGLGTLVLTRHSSAAPANP